jgi:hypothetical protein
VVLFLSSVVEIKYQIPHDLKSHFPSLFKEIEMAKEKLGVRSYALQMTTLEEVHIFFFFIFLHSFNNQRF